MQVAAPAILVHDRFGAIIGWDARAQELLGFEAGEAVGRSLSLIVDEAAPEGAASALRLCKRKDERWIRVLWRSCPITDGADGVLAYSAILTKLDAHEPDATAPKGPAHAGRAARSMPPAQSGASLASGPPELSSHAHLASPRRANDGPTHEQLRRDRARLESIITSLPGVVISYYLLADGTTEVSFASSAAQAVYGYSPRQIEDDSSVLFDRLNRDDAAATSAAMEESARTGRPWHGEYRYAHPSEGEKWLETHFTPSREPDGRVVWNGVVLDVTKRKRGEEQLKVVQAQLGAAIEAAQLGVWILDIEKNLIWGNERQRRLWDLPDDVPSWYGPAQPRALVHPDDLALVDREMGRAIASGEPLELEFRLRRADGGSRWISMRSQTDNHPDGRPRRLMGINVDITHRKLVADATLRSQKLEALGTLAGGIAHDFNNVLFAISGNASLALGQLPKQSATRRFLQEIVTATGRASELVRQILTFSRPQDQRLEVLSLAGPVLEAVQLARATLPALIEIETELDPATPLVLGDAGRIVQVVLNLCTNAAHAIGKGSVGRIELRLAAESVEGSGREPSKSRMPRGRYAVLAISDDGCGMDEQTQARIFDPFFTTKPPGEGSGLGLSMVHGTVTALGGAISVYSQIGKGTTFRLYLPATDQPASIAPRPLAQRAGGGQEILLVDDEPMIMNLGRAMLETLGYRPTAFERAADALAAFRREPARYRAALTDLSMPAMSGFDLARELLALRRDLPILLMSGYLGPDERAEAARIGVREIVLKPVSIECLSGLLADLFRNG